MPARPLRGRPATEQAAIPGHFIQCRLPTELYEWLRLRTYRPTKA